MNTKRSLPKSAGYLIVRLLGLLLLILLVAGFAQSKPPADLAGNETLTEFEAELEALRQEMLIPGMSAAVVQDQELLWAKGFGYADLERQIEATAETPYHLASVTKPIAATVLMQLVEEGALSLEDPVADYGVYLDNLGEINVWHLLTHTSEGPPGITHDYNGGRYALLERVMAGASGKPFGQLLQERILTPLEMTRTAPNPTWGWGGFWASLGLAHDTGHYPDVYRELAAPYQLDPDYSNVPGSYSLHFSPAAGLLSSATDLAKFDIALDQARLLEPATREQMFAPAIAKSGRTLIYGLGWYSQEYKNTRLIWHSGGWQPSISALLLKAPDLNLTFIILANNYNLTGPYPMDQGDVLYSAPAMAFYKHFVFPRQFGKTVPAVDWSADPESLLAQLNQVEDDDVRDVLERDLWAHRKLYGAAGRADLAEQLGQLALKAFPRSNLRYAPPTKWLNTTRPEMTPVAATPKTLLLLGRLLLAWLALTAVAILFLVVDFIRGSALPRPIKAAWLLNAIFFGPLALVAYLASDRRPDQGDRPMRSWRRALGPSMFGVIAPLISAVVGLYFYGIYRPNTEFGPNYLLLILLAGFLLSWLLFQAPLRAWVRSERFWGALLRSAPATLVSTLLALIGILAAAQALSAWWFRDMPLNTPYFLIYTISGSVIGAALVYPVQLWLSRRGLTNWPARPSGRPGPKPAGSPRATPALEA